MEERERARVGCFFGLVCICSEPSSFLSCHFLHLFYSEQTNFSIASFLFLFVLYCITMKLLHLHIFTTRRLEESEIQIVVSLSPCVTGTPCHYKGSISCPSAHAHVLENDARKKLLQYVQSSVYLGTIKRRQPGALS